MTHYSGDTSQLKIFKTSKAIKTATTLYIFSSSSKYPISSFLVKITRRQKLVEVVNNINFNICVIASLYFLAKAYILTGLKDKTGKQSMVIQFFFYTDGGAFTGLYSSVLCYCGHWYWRAHLLCSVKKWH